MAVVIWDGTQGSNSPVPKTEIELLKEEMEKLKAALASKPEAPVAPEEPKKKMGRPKKVTPEVIG